jgi:hypothetical protein
MLFRKFEAPEFSTGILEVRVTDGEVAIYGTREGLHKLATLILRLADKPPPEHTHVEDYQFLTDCSVRLTVVVLKAGDG